MTRPMPHSPAERMLALMNPAPERDDVLSPAAEAELDRILATARPAGTPRGHDVTGRWVRGSGLVAAAAALAVVAVVGLQLGTSNDPAMAATPVALSVEHPPTRADAPQELRRIAQRVEQLSDDTGTGSSAVITTQSWNLFTRVDGEQVTSEVVPVETVKRVDADGTAAYTRVYSFEDGSTRTTRTSVDNALAWPWGSLGTTVADIDAQLAPGHEQQGAAGRFDAVVEAYQEAPLVPATRAAVLRWLAQTPGIETVGEVADRIGRDGVGFTVTSAFSGLPTQYMLIVDPGDGRILDYEEKLTTDAGKLNVEVPAVINYIVWKSATYS